MITSGFTNAPVSQFLVFGTVIGALLASLTDTRYYIHIQVVPHLWNYGQFWRVLTWQVGSFRVPWLRKQHRPVKDGLSGGVDCRIWYGTDRD